MSRVGDFELQEEIGRGGMGVVYRARQISLNRTVAVKLILTGPLASREERRRFLAEAEAAAALEHPGIVAIHEAGEEDGQPFFAMQLIEGESLSARLRRTRGPLPAREATVLILTTALAVQHAHERGFLHRDLKPGNILLDLAGAPHVTDFGLARRLDAEVGLTLTGAALGTPSYMAPEQTDTRRPPTTAVDIYSLGAIFYEMLSSRPPFTGDSLPALFLAIRQDEPASLTAAPAGVDRDLDVICLKCLEKEPLRRYRTAQALADDLQRWLNGEPITARAARAPERLWRWCRRRPAIAGLAAASLLIFAAGLAGVVSQWRRADREAALAVAALRQAEESLWKANVSEAKALRISRARGQRTLSLASLGQAAAHRPALELRNEAIAALALPDLGEPVFHPRLAKGASDVNADSTLTRTACRVENRIVFQKLGADTPYCVLDGPALHSFRISPDFRHIFTARSQDSATRLCTGALWDAETGARIVELPGAAPGAAFTPDGTKLIVIRSGLLEIRNAGTGAILSLAPCAGVPTFIEASPDGRRAAIFKRGTGELWSLTPPAFVSRLVEFPTDVLNAQWQPDGGSLICGSDRDAWCLRPALGTAQSMTKHDREGVLVFMHPSGLFSASTSWDGILRFLHPVLSEPLQQTSGLRPRQFSTDGHSLLVTVGERPGICSVTPPDVWRCAPPRGDEDEPVRSIQMSPDGCWIAETSHSSLVLRNTTTLLPTASLPLQDGEKAVFISENELLVLDRTRGLLPVKVTHPGPGQPVLEAAPPLAGDWGTVKTFALSPHASRLLTGGSSSGVFDLRTGARLFSLKTDALSANPAWSPDGRWLATGYWNNKASSGSDACVWSATDGSLVQKLPAGNCAPYFTPDGRRLFISATHELVEYETLTWREIRRHTREASGLDHGYVAFAPDAGLAAIMADESTVRLVSLATGEELARLTQPFPHKISTAGLAFSRDGRWLACEARKSIRLWDIRLLHEKLRPLALDWPDQPPAR